jgi:hypothetical protein
MDAILADTNELQGDWVNGGRLDLILDARASQTTADAIETDTQDIQSRLPAALVTGRMSSDAVAISGSTAAADSVEANIGNLDASIAGLNDPTAATIADAVWDEAATGHTEAGKAGEQLWTDVDAILADTNELQTDWVNGGRLDLIIDAILADTNELQTDDVPGLIAALNDLSAAAVNAEVVDALATDTYAEPTGVPGATVTLATKIGFLYMALRNQVTVTATKKTFFDDGGAAEWEKDLSDDATTYTETEANAI